MYDDVLTRNDDEELSVRVVNATEQETVVNPNDVYTRDTDGNLAIRTVGNGGGGGGSVTSVNGQTGAVVLDAEDVGAQETLVSGTNIKTVNGNSLLGSGNIAISGVPQYTTMPTAAAGNVGEICQYVGATNSTYTNGYFYESSPVYALESVTISQTVGSTLANILINIETFKEEEQPTGDETVNFVYTKKPGSAAYTTMQGAVTFSGGDIEALFDAHGWATQDNGVFWWTGTQWSIGPQVGSTWFNYTAEQLESDFGITVTTTGEIQLNDNVAYVWTPAQYVWEKNNVEVDISDYGISYDNWPDVGDTLTVVYTAAAISGCVWKGKEVQTPGIKWATSVDLASNVKPYDWDIYPAFTIAGGLPDGDYECYYQAKVAASTTPSDGPAGLITFKLCFNVDNTDRAIYGTVSPVIDGNWISPAQKRLPLDQSWISGLMNYDINDSGDLIMLFSNSNLSSDIHGYVPELNVPECFKLSGVKNVATGVEYIATGAIYNDEPYNQWNGGLSYEPLTRLQVIPSYYMQASASATDISYWYLSGLNYTNNVWDGTAEVSIAAQLGDDRLALTLKIFISDYELTIETATGVFAGTQVGLNDSTVHIVPNFPNGTTGTVSWAVASKGGSQNSIYMNYSNDQVPAGTTMLNVLKVGETPTAVNYLGKICQYDGTTTASYTNGHFYKATGTITTVPASVTVFDVDPSGTTVTIDVDSFVSAVANITGWSEQEVCVSLNNGYEMRYESNSQELYWSTYGTFNTTDTATLMAYITISPMPTGGDIARWYTTQYVPSSKVLTGGAWEEVAVQTTATAPSTLPVLLAADWSSNTQTVSVQGVTASNFVIVSPAPASATDYAAAGILCTAQASNSLTFTCTQTPSNDIDVNVLILG